MSSRHFYFLPNQAPAGILLSAHPPLPRDFHIWSWSPARALFFFAWRAIGCHVSKGPGGSAMTAHQPRSSPSRKRWRDNKEHRTPPLRPVCLIVLWPRKFAQVSFFFFKLRTSLSPISLGYTRQRESEKAQERMSETEKGISAFESSGYYRFSPGEIRFSFFTNRISRSPISLGYTRLRRKLESDNN